MDSEYQNRFDVAELLRLDGNVKVLKDEHLALEDDENVILSWTIPYGSDQECIDYLWANRQTLTDFETPFRAFEGVYRSVSITTEPMYDNGRVIGSLLKHTISKGFYTSIPSDPAQWTWARLVSSEIATSNDSTAGVDNATSADVERWFTIQFPYCSPDHTKAMIESITRANITTPVIVRGETLGSDLQPIVASSKKEEDGSRTITVMLARPEYVIEAFTDFETDRAQDVIYVWNAPKNTAQGIVDAWKALEMAGSGASCSYNEGQKLVDIILYKASDDDPPNLTTSWIDESCEKKVRYHFAWGYTKEQIGQFIENHNGTVDGGSGSTLIGVTRTVRVSSRSDGKYDGTIVEEYVGFDETKHVLNISLKYGTLGAKEVHQYGWNAPIERMVTIQTSLDAVIGNQKAEFRVSRKDNCTFDYEYVIITEVVREIAIGGASGPVEEVEDPELIGYLGFGGSLGTGIPEPSSVAVTGNSELIPPMYMWGYNVEAIPPFDGWVISNISVDIRPNGRINYSIKLSPKDQLFNTAAADATTKNRRQEIDTYLASDTDTLPDNSEFSDELTRDVIIIPQINPQSGMISWEKRVITWRMPATWSASHLIYSVGTTQKRKRVLFVSTVTNKMLVQAEKRRITRNTYRVYTTIRPTSTAPAIDDYEYTVGMIDENLWHADTTTVTIDSWADDADGGGLTWINLPAT